jgi:phosphoglycerol transferase MdoB-like AlkP superfamily enzyme
LSGCLPGRLAAMGYRTLAVHGMNGNMFSRSDWYSRIGFQEQWFHNELMRQGLPDCLGAFFGTCDAAIADWIGRRLGGHDDPYFVHWVTLNSHLPVPVPSLLQNGASCSLTPLLSRKPALCAWYQLVLNVHESVSRLSMTTFARPTVFVIVGDHAPPFTDPGLASQFSSTDVPYVLLVPRGDRESRTLVAGVANFTLRMRASGRSSGAANHARRIQYGNGVARPTLAVCR